MARSNLSEAILNLHDSFRALEDELRSSGYSGKRILITTDRDRIKEMIENIYHLTTFFRRMAQGGGAVKKENEKNGLTLQLEELRKENVSLKALVERYKQDCLDLKYELSVTKQKYSLIGRPEKFTETQKKRIFELRAAGYSLDKIKDEMGCSKGLVHKILSEYKD